MMSCFALDYLIYILLMQIKPVKLNFPSLEEKLRIKADFYED